MASSAINCITPKRKRIKIVEYYYVTKIPKNSFVTTKETTWSNIIACISDRLNANEFGDTFVPLRRYEGGFACTKGPGFVSSEHFEDPPNPRATRNIRFIHQDVSRWEWDSESPVSGDFVVFKQNLLLSLSFQGTNCQPWSSDQVKWYMAAISEGLDLKYVRNPHRRYSFSQKIMQQHTHRHLI
jgi:hypothetical protein